MADLGNDIFVVGPERQVLKWFGPNHVFAITDVESAAKGIDVIVVEGEGTSTTPFERCDDPAHFYKFSEIYEGRRIVRTDDGFAYTGAPVPFDAAGVYPMVDNPRSTTTRRAVRRGFSPNDMPTAIAAC